MHDRLGRCLEGVLVVLLLTLALAGAALPARGGITAAGFQAAALLAAIAIGIAAAGFLAGTTTVIRTTASRAGSACRRACCRSRTGTAGRRTGTTATFGRPGRTRFSGLFGCRFRIGGFLGLLLGSQFGSHATGFALLAFADQCFLTGTQLGLATLFGFT